MTAKIIIRLTAEDRPDALQMGAKYRAYKEAMHAKLDAGEFGDPAKVTLHFLLTTRRFE